MPASVQTMEMLRRLFGRNKPAETGETAKSDGEITDWHRGYGFLNIVDANPLDYVDPFPFLRLREDLRRNVLEFVVGASWNGVRRLAEPGATLLARNRSTYACRFRPRPRCAR